MTATYTLNAEKNGIEIRFDSKPAAAVLEAIKSAGYRWSRARRIWWAHQSPKALEAAQAVADGQIDTTAGKDTAPALDLWERTRWTPGPGGDECHAHTVGSNYKAGLSNKEIAATVKRELSRRFPAIRWSVTTQGYNSINVYLKSGPYKNHKEVSRHEWKDASPELFAIMNYAEKLLASYNWDDSDPYTDYSSRNFYDFVEVYDYQQTEPTEAQRAEIEAFRVRLAEEKKLEEERREQEWQAEQARRAIEAQEAAKREEARRTIIAGLTAAATVRALEPSEQYIIPSAPFARKAADLEEARQAVEEDAVDVSDCIILEEITAPADILTKWGESGGVLYDIPVLFRAVGGARTFDPRITSMEDYRQMSQQERGTVKWYTLAAAIYTDAGELWAVVDDEGYTYARYIAIAPWEGSAERLPVPQEQGPDDDTRAQAERVEDISTEIIERLGLIGGGWETSPEYARQMEPVMETITVDTIRAVTIDALKSWLYRRQDQRQTIREQLTRASIPAGERVTIIKESDFGGISTTVATWDHWEPCTYAQYTDAAKLIVKPKRKRGLWSMTLHRGPAVLIVAGEVGIPEEILWEVVYTKPGATMKKSRFASCDPAAMQAVREYVQSTGARIYMDAKQSY